MEIDELRRVDPDVVTADGFDDCLIGWTDSWNGRARPVRAVYDAQRCIRALMRNGEMTYDEAADYFAFNTQGFYPGPEAPIYVWVDERAYNREND